MMMRPMLLALMLVVATLPAMAADRTYINNQAVRDKGVAALVARMGETRPAARLLFTPDKIIATMQDDSGPDFAEWTAQRTDLLVANIHSVTGPRRGRHAGRRSRPRRQRSSTVASMSSSVRGPPRVPRR